MLGRDSYARSTRGGRISFETAKVLDHSSMTDGAAPHGSSSSGPRRMCKGSPNLLICKVLRDWVDDSGR